ncbi:MAG: ribonuclease Y, partial [Planctomycetota bacterium]
MEALFLAIGLVAGLAGGFVACFVYFRKINLSTFRRREDVLGEAKSEADKIVGESKTEARRVRDGAESEIRERRNELKQFENRLVKKEDVLERRSDSLQGRERHLEKLNTSVEKKERGLLDKEAEINRIIEDEKKTLHEIAGLSKDEAIKMLIDKLEPELEREKAELIRKSTDSAKEEAETKAKRIISTAISRYAAEHTTDSVVTVVDLPNEEMKGRIIGREGRNIRAFERATGVDVIVDDTPGVIVLSSFDGVRREMARRAMEKLIFDGRIHPSRIEEVTEQTKREMEEHITKVGKEFLYEHDVRNGHPKLITLIGRLRYRSSYGQNVLQHVREVAELSSVMAAEMGMDPKVARRCGIFHDIGKAVDQEFEGSHPVIGGELLKRFDEPKEIIDSATNHHGDADAK